MNDETPFEDKDAPPVVPSSPAQDKTIVKPLGPDSDETWKPFEKIDAPAEVPTNDGPDVPVPPNSDG